MVTKIRLDTPPLPNRPPTRKEMGLQPNPPHIGPVPRSKKRGPNDLGLHPSDLILPSEYSSTGRSDTVVDMDADEIRSKIQNLIDSGEMKVTQFQKEIGVDSGAYRRFMKLKGPMNNFENQTFEAAYIFFKNRHLEAEKGPFQKKRKSDDGSATSEKSENSDSKSSSKKNESSGGKSTPKKRESSGGKSTPEKLDPPDISDVLLHGEEKDKVPVFDTCDEVRRKMNEHIAKYKVTLGELGRQFAKQYHTKSPTIQSGQVSHFRNKDGPDSGNTGLVFYAAYVYFEKLRIKEGEEKTQHRINMEKIWKKEGGFNITVPAGRHVFCFPEEGPPYTSEYGQLVLGKRKLPPGP